MSVFKNYYSLTKPGIIYGNAITVIAGFFLAAKGTINYALLLETIAGISLLMASGLVLNNYIDRDIDALMERTKNRVLVKGLIAPSHVFVYAGVLGVAGIWVLYWYTNLLTLCVAVLGFLAYVVVYSMWAKRNSLYGTEWGSISGAIPPVVGYCAASGAIDLSAAVLFVILCVWQIVHAYAIAIYRIDDYRAAHIPIAPLKRGIPMTKISMFANMLIFIIFGTALGLLTDMGGLYVVAISLLGCSWAIWGAFSLNINNDRLWARRVFFSSIGVIVLFCLIVITDSLF